MALRLAVAQDLHILATRGTNIAICFESAKIRMEGCSVRGMDIVLDGQASVELVDVQADRVRTSNIRIF